MGDSMSERKVPPRTIEGPLAPAVKPPMLRQTPAQRELERMMGQLTSACSAEDQGREKKKEQLKLLEAALLKLHEVLLETTAASAIKDQKEQIRKIAWLELVEKRMGQHREELFRELRRMSYEDEATTVQRLTTVCVIATEKIGGMATRPILVALDHRHDLFKFVLRLDDPVPSASLQATSVS